MRELDDTLVNLRSEPVESLHLPAALSLILVAASYYRPRSRPQPGRCPECDYDLTGNASGICPECGANIGNESAA